jgi:hypothetical protein
MKIRVRAVDGDHVGIIHEGEYESLHVASGKDSRGPTIQWLAQLTDNKILISVENAGALIKEHGGTLWICSSPSDLSYRVAGDLSVVWTKEPEKLEGQVVPKEVSDGAH